LNFQQSNTNSILNEYRKKSSAVIIEIGALSSDNGCYFTEHTYNHFNCGTHWKFRKWIHSTGELHGLGQEKKDVFS
jgi:hypothetical protein